MSTNDKLTYNDLKLPKYQNTRAFHGDLTVTDVASAAVLGGLNLCLVGRTGFGKTQLAMDILNSYFGGTTKENGYGVFVRAHPELDLLNEVVTQFNMASGKREITPSIQRGICYVVDEFNRAPAIAQNQLFGVGDGMLDVNGVSHRIGNNGYHILIPTANLGNGEYTGTFKTDVALLNRFALTLDLDGKYATTKDDDLNITLNSTTPNVVTTQSRDLTDKIIEASKEIDARVKNLLTDKTSASTEALAAMLYLTNGLTNCQKSQTGKKIASQWGQTMCTTCPQYDSGKALCAQVQDLSPRSRIALMKTVVALDYVGRLKDPQFNPNPTDFVFDTFELCAAYKQLVHPKKLQAHDQSEIDALDSLADTLKQDFVANKDMLCATLDHAKKTGAVETQFIVDPAQPSTFYPASGFSSSTREKLISSKGYALRETPSDDARVVGLSWLKPVAQRIANSKNGAK